MNISIIKHRARLAVLLLLAMLMPAVAWADIVTEEQARQQALEFLTGHQPANGPRRAPGTTPQVTLASKVSGLYVFNVDADGGFVIISNDDAAIPVLGYSDSGTFNAADMPSNMRAWLQGYADQIAWLQAHGTPSGQNTRHRAPRRIGSHATTAISPLLGEDNDANAIKWDQGTPYNNLCPIYSGSDRSATGCVATAMAQVMKYHQWPTAATTAIPGYTTDSYGFDLTDGLPATTFEWANMKPSYSGSYTTEEATAVATLMQYCGYSVQMDYGPSSGSNTDMVAAALKAYFDYNKTTTQFVSRSFYTPAKWADLIYHELANRRPVVYGGMSSGGGHEFVCDGYKYENSTDQFHINWGWSGQSDGYFVLSALDPDVQGIGGSSSTDGFNYGQDAVIGIQPSTGTGTIANVTPNEINLTVNSMTPSSNPAVSHMAISIKLNITNNSTDDYDGDIYIGAKDGVNYEILAGNKYTITAGETRDVVIPFTPIEVGTYNLVLFLPNKSGSYTTDGIVYASLDVISSITNNYIPVYGYYCDYSEIQSQIIIPASDLQDMLYAELNGVTFYANTSSAISWGDAEFDVYLQEVTESTFANTTLKDWNQMDKVYSGSLSVGNNGRMVITFDRPFQYMGGNLLVGINQTKLGDEGSVSWIGNSVNGASIGVDDHESIRQWNFLPITTFDYTPDSAPTVARPTGLTVNYTGGTTAQVSWTSTESLFDIDVNGTVTENVTNPYTLTNLDLATVYTIKVRAKKDSDVSDWSASVTFTTDLSDDMCQIRFELFDSYGDGWNGAAIQVLDVLTETIIGTVDNTSAAEADVAQTYNMDVPNGRDIQFVWVSGSYDEECYINVYDVNGDLIYEFVLDDNGPSAGVLDTYHVDCTVTPWRKPTDLAASNIGPHSAVLSWTENSSPAATAWVIAYKSATNADFTEVEAAANPFTLTGLATETEYTVKVRPATDEATKWSKTITFTTGIATPVPTDIAVSPAPTTAVATWTGFADSYNLRYRTTTGGVVFSDDFENGLGQWTVIRNGNGTASTDWRQFNPENFSNSNISAHSGSYVAMSRSWANNAYSVDNWIISPQVELGGTMTYWVMDDGDNHEHYDVYVSTTAPDPDAFNADAFTKVYEPGNASSTWTEHTVDLSAYAGQMGYVAFRNTDNNQDYLLIDDVAITITGEQGEWVTKTDVTSPCTIDGLTESTSYELQVQGIYPEGTSDWTAVTTFTTPTQCDAPNTLAATGITHDVATLTWTGYQDSYNVKYRTAGGSKVYAFDDFENGNQGWTDIADGIFTGVPYSGTHMLVMGYETTGTAQYLITPELPDLESGSTMQFYQRYFSSATTFKVGFSSTTADVDAFTWGDEQDAASSYSLFSAEIPVGTKYIAVQHTSAAQANAFFVDYCGIYGPYVTPGEWQTTTTDEPILALTGLMPGTEYEWQVQGTNTACGTTEWSETATFTALKLIELADAATDNSDVIDALDGETVSVTLSGRTLYKDGEWNTICLPFDVVDGDNTDEQTFTGTPLAGAIAKTLTDATMTGTHVTLTFGEAVTTLSAGVPYIIKWAEGANIENPVFSGVTIQDKTEDDRTIEKADGHVKFIGYYDAFDITPANDDIYYMTSGSTLKHTGKPRTLMACRAYFQFSENIVNDVREFILNFGDDTQGIDDAAANSSLFTLHSSLNEGWYDLNGRKLDGKPAKKGVYIQNGYKVVIK